MRGRTTGPKSPCVATQIPPPRVTASVTLRDNTLSTQNPSKVGK